MEGFAVNWSDVSGEDWGKHFYSITRQEAYRDFMHFNGGHAMFDPDFIYNDFAFSCDKVDKDDKKNLKSNLYVLKECVNFANHNSNPLIALELGSILKETVDMIMEELQEKLLQKEASSEAFQLCVKYNTKRMKMSKDEVTVVMTYVVDDLSILRQNIHDVKEIHRLLVTS